MSSVACTLLATLATTAAMQSGQRPSPPLRAASPRASMLTNVGAGIFAVSGALAWVAPGQSLANYGLATDASALVTMRAVGCWRICGAAVLLAGTRGPSHAAGVSLVAAALTTLVSVANWDVLSRPLGNQIPGVVLLSILGKLTLGGRVGPRWAAGVYLLLGGLIWAAPTSTIQDVYEIQKPVSDVGRSMLSLSGGALVSTGVFLAGLVRGLALPQCLALTFATDAALALKWALLEVSSLGGAKVGGFLWAISSLAVAALSLA